MPTELEKKLPKTMLTTLTKFVTQDKNRTIRNVITLLVVFALEALITTEGIFECPVESHARYGWVFIFIPALILAVLSVMLSEDFLKLMQGVCYREAPRKQRKRCFIPCGKPKWSIVKIGDSKFFVVVYNGLAAASLWLFWAFLQGSASRVSCDVIVEGKPLDMFTLIIDDVKYYVNCYVWLAV